MKKILAIFALLFSQLVSAGNNYGILDTALYPTTFGTATYCWISNGAGTAPSWQVCGSGQAGTGTVTSASVVSANGFSGTVATATTTPAITLSTTVTGLMLGNGSGASAYGGATCTSQFIRNLNASGTATCASVALTDLAAMATNTIVGNATSGSAAPTALTMPSCSGASNALTWTTNTGFGCNTIAGGGGSVTITGTPSSGQAAEWTSASAIQGVATTGSGNYVKATSASLTTPNIGAASGLSLTLSGSTSGTLQVKPAAVAGTGSVITFPGGTTDFSATGGTSQVVKQTSSGGALTVGQLAASDMSNGTTGSGGIVLAVSPSLTTPTLGVATATSINKMAITAPATGSTLAVADGKTLTVSNTVTFSGTDGSTVNFGTGGTIAAVSGTPGVGDIPYFTSSTGSAVLTAGAAGTFPMFNGPITAPIVSTLKLPNAATSGGVLYASAANTIASSGALTANAFLTGGGAGVAPNSVALTGLVLGNGSSAPTAVTAPAGTVVGTTDTQTLTNKRVTPRTGTTTSSATPTINTDNVDVFSITALATGVTSFTTNLSGTPTEGQSLIIWIKDNGGAQTLSFGTSFAASSDLALPSTTTAGKYLYLGFKYNATLAKWIMLAKLDNI